MIGVISLSLGAYEALAFLFGWRTVSRQRGILRVGVFAWWVALGAHLIIEAFMDHIAEEATL